MFVFCYATPSFQSEEWNLLLTLNFMIILNNLVKPKFNTMQVLELKSNIHQIIDTLDNELLLQTLYDFLKQKETEKDGLIWSTLNEAQKQEVLLAFEESEDAENLVDAKVVFKNFK